jgi:hypothetical protein
MFKSGKVNWIRAEGALLPIGCCLVPDLDMSLCFPEMSLSFTESEDFEFELVIDAEGLSTEG